MTDNFMVINNREVRFDPGQTILEVAGVNNIEIPTLCHLKGTTPTGACRICVVEVEGANNLIPSCSEPARAGMVVQTESSEVIKARRSIIRLMLSSGNHNCDIKDFDTKDWTQDQLRLLEGESPQELCPAWGDCRLQDLAFKYQVKAVGLPLSECEFPMETGNPLIVRDFSRCILCGRCVQACREVQVNNAIDFGYRGAGAKIVAGTDVSLKDSDCVFCGECIQVCPVGALFEKKARYTARPWETQKIRTTCPYCGVGCQQILHVKDGTIMKVTGAEDGKPNLGRLCVKGRFGYDFIYSKERLKTPLIREGDTFRSASWDEALNLVVQRFTEIIDTHGPDALAGVSCARSINEDSYQMQKLFRAVFKTNNIDHCART
jgi:formate dehydrogenase major subunit